LRRDRPCRRPVPRRRRIRPRTRRHHRASRENSG
jgi:hypothetical protein